MTRESKIKENSITLIFAVVCLLFIIPVVLLFSISFSKESDIAAYGYSLIPKTISFDAYKYLFNNPKQLIDAYIVTFEFTIMRTVLSLLLMSMCAYALMRKDFKGRKFVSFYLYFTCLFSGGLVPSYILITQYLHLQDNIWVYILPSLIAPMYVFMIRTNFQSLPNEVVESARVDGAGDYRIFFQIILPLSKPVLATVALFTFLGSWNDWNTSMLYINNRDDLISLQYLMQRLLMNIELLKDPSIAAYMGNVEVPAETTRMAMAVVTTGPVLVVFPFFQKYFTKGMTVGSVKG